MSTTTLAAMRAAVQATAGDGTTAAIRRQRVINLVNAVVKIEFPNNEWSQVSALVRDNIATIDGDIVANT